jgi:F420-0:gamma-glutamyl ligase
MAGAPASGDALAAALAQRVQQDFVDGHVVHVDGWVLSLTEARQCALHSLTARG